MGMLEDIFDAGGEFIGQDGVHVHVDGIRVSKQPAPEMLRRLRELGADPEKLRSLPRADPERLLANLMKPQTDTGNVATE
jgi:hypothetical protein